MEAGALAQSCHEVKAEGAGAHSEGEVFGKRRRAKEYIAAGDIFQVVLSQRWDFEPGVAPLDLYRALRTVNPSPYMFFLRFGGAGERKQKSSGGMHVLGSSPEMLVRVGGRETGIPSDCRDASARPRRGGRRRAGKENARGRKERAEHVMLVDLGRNDLGRVSEYGSVKVRDLMYVERYSHVMHLVSALEGRLRPELNAMDAFAACFPAGTLSGAPKVRAMQIIEELEPTRRGVYGGSVLYADFAGNLDSCIAIRTLLMKGGKAYLQAGAGIVADSDPEREFEETENKAKAVLRAVEMARRHRIELALQTFRRDRACPSPLSHQRQYQATTSFFPSVIPLPAVWRFECHWFPVRSPLYFPA